MKPYLLLLAVIVFSSGSPAYAYGPKYITDMSLTKNSECADGTRTCVTICYDYEDGSGRGGRCSFPAKLDEALSLKLKAAQEILKGQKKKNDGLLQFGLEELYSKGKGVAKEFTPEELFNAIIEEDELRDKKARSTLTHPRVSEEASENLSSYSAH